MSLRFFVLLGFCVLPFFCLAQSIDSNRAKVVNLPIHFLQHLQRRANHLNNQLAKCSQSCLQEMANREVRIQERLATIYPSAAQTLFAGSGQRYAALTQKINQNAVSYNQNFSGSYPPYLDSLQGSIKFLQKNPLLVGSGNATQLQGAGEQLQSLQTKMGDADQAQAFMQQRKQLIGQYLAQHGLTTGPISKFYKGMNQPVYYYSQQLRTYKEMWTNPDRLTQKALTVLNRLPAFQVFMKYNSMLGGMFHLPGAYGSPQAISGLQTRAQVSALVQAQTGGGLPGTGRATTADGGGGADAMQSNIQDAQAKLDNYKSKLSSLGAGNGDMDIPNFKPNDQKNKTLLHRLEYGADFQTMHNNYYFPMVTDFGASLGYKLGHNNVVGIGASYKLGWGKGIQHIAFSSQGLGLRSFLQIHIKNSFSVTGGFEYNYTVPFASFQNLKLIQNWTKSGLVGVTKTVSLKNRVFKKTSLSLLWDFLSYQQIPQTQPVLFRIGYTF